MKKKHLIIFDIDGTLTDSVHIHQDAFREGLKQLGIREFNDKFGSYIHHTDYHIAKVIYETATNSAFDSEMQEEFEDIIHNMISQHTIKEIPGALQFIQQVERDTEFGVCYATGSLRRPAEYKLNAIQVDHHAELLIASNEIEEREKILELAIESALRYFDTAKFDRIISFGDGIWDLKTAQNLQLEFIGIGQTNYQAMAQQGMTRHYSDFTTFDIHSI